MSGMQLTLYAVFYLLGLSWGAFAGWWITSLHAMNERERRVRRRLGMMDGDE